MFKIYMNDFFTFKDDVEGKVGIGKLPLDLQGILDEISKEFYNIIPNKNDSAYHAWVNDMPPNIKSKVKKIQNHSFFNGLCDGSKKCIKKNDSQMDELYYSNPKNNLNKINLYGTAGNYKIHKDSFMSFNGIKFY